MVGEVTATVVVVAGGGPIDAAAVADLPAGAFVIAADSGVDVARAIGLAVDLAVGDFDSVSAGALAQLEREGAAIDRHPVAKDATDLALALDAAVARRPERVILLGGHGGRLDHLLANALLLAAPSYASVTIEARMGEAVVTVVRRAVTLHGQPGDLVSLVPPHGVARGVTTEGLLYPLEREDLHPGSTRGVSNELAATAATITVADGVLLAIQPGHRGTHWEAAQRSR